MYKSVFLLGDVTKLSNGFYDGKNKSIQLSKSFLLEKRVNTDEIENYAKYDATERQENS
jgi:hypothetical protein